MCSKSWLKVRLVMWAVRAARVFCGASARELAILFLVAFQTCSVGPEVGGVRGHVDGRDALQSPTGSIKIVQSLGVVEPGVVQDHCDLLSLIGLALKTIHHEGDLLGVLISLDRVDPHFPGRQAQCPEERPARLLAVHVQPCSLSLGKPHAPRLGLVLHANLVNGAGLPSVLEQIGDLVPDLGHPPGDGLLVAAPRERVGEQRLMPRKCMSSR